MNTPEQQGRNLARDMIALVEAHISKPYVKLFALDDGARCLFQAKIWNDELEGEDQAAFDNGFSGVIQEYVDSIVPLLSEKEIQGINAKQQIMRDLFKSLGA